MSTHQPRFNRCLSSLCLGASYGPQRATWQAGNPSPSSLALGTCQEHGSISKTVRALKIFEDIKSVKSFTAFLKIVEDGARPKKLVGNFKSASK